MDERPDPSGGEMIPAIWRDELVSFGGFMPPPEGLFEHGPLVDRPAPSFRKRFRSWRRRPVVDAREWVALKVAPWLEPDDWSDW